MESSSPLKQARKGFSAQETPARGEAASQPASHECGEH